jgi:hypothetical protein
MTTAKRINKDITVDQVEELYSELQRPLMIPNGFKSLNIGLTARLAQFFITQQKRCDTINSFLWLAHDQKLTRESVLDDPICLTALLMATDITGPKGEHIKRDLSKYLVERFSQSIYLNRRKVQMFAVDHSISKYAYPECFYQPKEASPQAPFHYYVLLQEYFRLFVKNSKLSNRDFMGLGELLAELIDNTEQHGKSDYIRGKSSRSVRAATFNTHLMITGQDSESYCGKSGPTADYVKSFRRRNETLSLLEITILDSGPGIYKSFPDALDNPDLATEADCVMSSFMNGITSKPNGFGLGRGLDRARKILNERKAYLSLRTGRLAMYRNFNSKPITFDDDVELFDEKTGNSLKFTEMNSVEGVALTILVPLQ